MGNITEERTSPSDVEQVKERVQDVAEQAKGKTRDELRTQIDTRTTEAGEQVASTARAFHRTSEQLRQEGNARAADLVEAIADRSERFGAYLSRADGDALLHDVEDFARRQPWLAAGAGALAGFMAARFVKSTSGNRRQTPAAQRYAVESSAVPTAGGSSGIS